MSQSLLKGWGWRLCDVVVSESQHQHLALMTKSAVGISRAWLGAESFDQNFFQD